MNRWEKTLIILLRLGGGITLMAIPFIVIPVAWMDAIHQKMGLGPLPGGAIVEYMARSLSALYAMHGAFLIYLSLDIRRYRGLLIYLAYLTILFGIGMLGIDAASSMPTWWVVMEGPYIIVVGVLLRALASKIERA